MNEFNPFLQIPLPPYRYLKQDKQSQSIPVLQLLTKVLQEYSPLHWNFQLFSLHPCFSTDLPWKSPRILAFNTLHTLQYITFSTVLMHHFIFTDNSEKTCFPPEFEHSPFPKPSLILHCMSILCSYELSQLPKQDILKLLRPPSDFQPPWNLTAYLGRRVGGWESTKCTAQVCPVRDPPKIWSQISFPSKIPRIWDEMNRFSLSSEITTRYKWNWTFSLLCDTRK